jgi:hypothetical protein
LIAFSNGVFVRRLRNINLSGIQRRIMELHFPLEGFARIAQALRAFYFRQAFACDAA